MFLQLPDALPGLPLTRDDDFRGKKAEKKEPDKVSAQNDHQTNLYISNLNSFPNEDISGWSKLEAFADNKIKVTKKLKFVVGRV